MYFPNLITIFSGQNAKMYIYFKLNYRKISNISHSLKNMVLNLKFTPNYTKLQDFLPL